MARVTIEVVDNDRGLCDALVSFDPTLGDGPPTEAQKTALAIVEFLAEAGGHRAVIPVEPATGEGDN